MTVPHRRLKLSLDLEADDLGELTSALENIIIDLRIQGRDIRDVTSGGYGSGFHLELSCDPDMTGDQYRVLLSQWRESRRAERVEAKP